MRFLTIAALAMLAPPAVAEDAALVFGTGGYDSLDRIRGGAEAVDAAAALADVGFTVISVDNGSRTTLAAALGRFAALASDADRLVVVLSGRFATDGAQTWYLPRDAARPALLSVGAAGVSVETILRLLSEAPGGAVLVIATDETATRPYDTWLREGIGTLDIPQGVTVLSVAPRAAARFIEGTLARPGGDLAALVAASDGVRAQGYLPRSFPFAGPETAVGAQPADPVTPPPATDAAERALWDGAVALDTPEAYANYLSRYPRGQFAAEAAARREAMLADPDRAARLAEEALQLTRDGSRDIQRALTLLSFNTRGIDGIFGPGTRGAITNWQQENGFAQTGYLTGEQVARLQAQAARRSAEIEAEAERQRQAQIVADRAYWDETGAAGDETGLRAYLDRYPDGLFAEAAQTRVAAFEDRQRQVAQAEDAAAWDRARGADTVAAYQDYLNAYPQGSFLTQAQARIAELGQAAAAAPQVEAGRAAERNLGLNALTRQLVEQRLAAAGLEPGPVDGEFNRQTRRAIRNYQRARDLGESGFLDEQTLILLLADALQ